MRLEIGQLISFSYQSERSHDRNPQVLILHPDWNMYPYRDELGNRRAGPPLLHGLNFNYLTDDEINIIRMIVDPAFQLKYFDNMEKKNRNLAMEFDRIMARAGAANITSPHDFYLKSIKPFIMPRAWDPYRLYDPKNMSGVRILQTQQSMLGKNKMGLFGVKNARGAGKSEDQIVSDLAMKAAQEEKTEIRQLTPTEQALIKRLQGNAQKLFLKYKKKFQFAKGPLTNNRTPNLSGNQPKFMKDKP